MFHLLFERSADAITVFDPRAGVFVDCNQAAVQLMRAPDKQELLCRAPAELAPPFQPDGRSSAQFTVEIASLVEQNGSHHFEWVARRFDGTHVPLEIIATAVPVNGRTLHIVVSRDISERKCAEAALRESEERFRLLFDRSADAMSLFDPKTGRFVASNEATVRLTRAPNNEALDQASPADISPQRQPDGRLSTEKIAEMVRLALDNGSHRFEWLARRFDGTQLPLDIVLTAIPCCSRPLLLTVARDMSEQKHAEATVRDLNATLERRVNERTAELSASEARLRTLVEHAPEAIVVFDGDTGRFETVNENAVRLFGRSREELLLLTPDDVSAPQQPDGRLSFDVAREKIDQALNGQTPVFEWLHRHSSGRTFVSEVRLLRLPAANRRLLRASILDTTDRRRRDRVQLATYQIAEAALAADDLPQLYRRVHAIVNELMPAKNFYIALLDPATQLISFPHFSDEIETTPAPRALDTGLTSCVLRTGKSLLVDGAMNARKRIVNGDVIFDGLPEVHYVESGAPAATWLGVPLNAGGRTFGVMAVQDYKNDRAYGEDEKQILSFVAAQTALAIERKSAEKALRESEQKFRALFEATSTGVMIHDENQYLEVNPAIVRMFGYASPADLIGKNPMMTSPPLQPGGRRTADVARERIAECAEHGKARFEWMARRADGVDFPVEVILTRIEMAGRQLMQAVVTDITERKRAEAELLKALAREQELGQLKSSFVSMVSHEFRTPLGIIQSSAEILLDYLDQLDPSERREHLLSITKNSRRMAEMMEEVLVLGRLDAGKMHFQPAPLALGKVCARIVDEVLSATARACPIHLRTGEMPDIARADERLLRHIVTNLLANAVKYSQPGGTVHFTIERQGDDAILAVHDQGIGIPEADQARLFSAFYRGSNVGSRTGTGLGLVIVKRCVELHGGSIEVQSKVAQGTTVTVKLPVFAPAAPALDRPQIQTHRLN